MDEDANLGFDSWDSAERYAKGREKARVARHRYGGPAVGARMYIGSIPKSSNPSLR
jgi:hypothetical protein